MYVQITQFFIRCKATPAATCILAYSMVYLPLMKCVKQVIFILPFAALIVAILMPFMGKTPVKAPAKFLLASREMSLEKRYSNEYVNDVFKDNILLTIAYMARQARPDAIEWEKVTKPFHYEVTLKRGEVFAFHDDVLPEYRGKVVKTTDAHFNSAEGFKSDGYLIGDGVCHLASLLNWVARASRLQVAAPTNHNFAAIPEIPKVFGTAIYSNPQEKGANALQNLYITNTEPNPIVFEYDYHGGILKVSVYEYVQSPILSANVIY